MRKNTMLSDSVRKIHFVGIKGIAMAALAVVAKQLGYTVTGSDVAEHFPSDDVLGHEDIEVWNGFHKNHVGRQRPDLVIYTGAHNGRDNVEVVAARALGISAMPHAQALGEFMGNYRQISVSGCHGKTTTSAMVATILQTAGINPSYAIGSGEVCGLGSPGHAGDGRWFVAEADEYVTDPGHDPTPRFMWQRPEILVITNIDFDHPDVFGNIEEVKSAYQSFVDKVPSRGVVIVSSDDEHSSDVTTKAQTIRVGESKASDYRVGTIDYHEGETTFPLYYGEKTVCVLRLMVPGRHNAINASMAAVTCMKAGVSWEKIAEGLRTYCGAKRRFEKIDEKGGVTFYDDYAHHPKEIKATLEAARSWYPTSRIVVVFQPHTFSRTKALIKEFGTAFAGATEVIITDIYASARERDTLGIRGETLVQEVASAHPNALFLKNDAHVERYLHQQLKKGDVVFFMGAGDIYSWERTVIKNLKF